RGPEHESGRRGAGDVRAFGPRPVGLRPVLASPEETPGLILSRTSDFICRVGPRITHWGVEVNLVRGGRAMNERDIFFTALRKPNATERSAFLDGACGGNADLREQVEALLREHEQLSSFLESPGPVLAGTVDGPAVTERPGTVIGPYKLIQEVGEGGMGTVWMAQQQEPVKRLVALKIIKPGLDSRQVLARFEAERQALALMDHPNIAKVLDAGEIPPAYAGGSPRPYFVMDLVKGVAITHYCDEHR